MVELNKNRFNKGTNYGRGLLEHSLRELGCGRSILTDKNGVVLCGNDVYDIATRLGKKIITIETACLRCYCTCCNERSYRVAASILHRWTSQW